MKKSVNQISIKQFQKILIMICFMLMMTLLCGCHKSQERIDQREAFEIRQTARNPLVHALERINLNVSDLTRPAYYEAGYNMISRMPLIDKISTSPFTLHQWATDRSNDFQHKENITSHDILKSVLEDSKGSSSNKTLPINKSCAQSLAESYKKLCYSHGSNANQKYLKMIKKAGFSEEFDRELGQLLCAISKASLLTKKAFSALTHKESEFLLSRPERFFYPNSTQFDFLTAPVYKQEEISFITRKIDFNSLYRSANIVTQAVDRFIYDNNINKKKYASDTSWYFKNGKSYDGVILKLISPIGEIVILGKGRNIIQGNAAILIDIGGNDTYVGDTANGRLMPGMVSVVIDMAGDDVYDNKMKRFAQGFGCMSVAMLADLEGNDKYISGNMGQGAGIYGVGVLEDLAGDDVYLMGLMGQGFGLFGTGILLDKNGNDRYMVNGLGQGAGSTMGFGYLVDCNGKDKYIADSKKTRGKLIPDNIMNHVQGAGLSIRSPEWVKHLSLYGGVGFLNDGKGDDFYYSNGGNCMGSSYFMSLGALVDHEGNDYYLPEKGYGIGSAVHLTSAIFIDRKGDDKYFADYHTGGVGSDRSMGIMIDGEGNDVYGPGYDYLKKKIQKEMADKEIKISVSELKKQINKEMADASYGAALKPEALGMMVDYKGNDQYFSRNGGYGESCGGVIPPVDPGDWSYAVLMDLNGKDYYRKKGMQDNHYLKYFGHGLCYDMIYEGTDIFNNDNIHKKINAQVSNIDIDRQLTNEMAEILNSDYFVRYSAIGKIVKQGTKNIYEIIDLLKESENNDLNRDLIEILNIFIAKKQFEKKHQKYLENLLQAKDPFVRGFTAHTLGAYKAQDSEQSLIQSLSEENENVRSQIIWALGHLDAYDLCEALTSIIINDPSLNCRREAVKALSRMVAKIRKEDIKKKKQIVDELIKCTDDDDNSIRAYAAYGLKNYIEGNRVKDTLKKLLNDENVYVRRSAAKALIETGCKEAVHVLIDTLKYPSIDTFEFYGHDLVKQIAFYCGVDFSKEKRYLYHTWIKWWNKNGKEVDLEKNLSIMKDIQNAFFVKHESQGVEIFKRLVQQNPKNVVIKNEFVRFCKDWINQKLLTQEEITSSVIRSCIYLQENIIQIEPDVTEHRVKLAGFYARLLNFEKAAEIIKAVIDMEPDNKRYKTIWNKYKKRAGS